MVYQGRRSLMLPPLGASTAPPSGSSCYLTRARACRASRRCGKEEKTAEPVVTPVEGLDTAGFADHLRRIAAGREAKHAPGGDRMDTLWSFLKGRAIYVSVAHDAFSFDISWLGVVLLIGAALLIRHLRR